MKNITPSLRLVAATSLLCALSPFAHSAENNFAATVIDYHPGQDASLINPYAAIGKPGGIVAAGTAFAGIQSVFNPHYEAAHLVQIGEGGELTLRFDCKTAVVAGMPEIGLFTNVGLIYDDGIANGSFGVDPVTVDVSADGITWISLGEVTCDLPADALTDAPSPFHPTSIGLTPADFSKPHALDLAAFGGKTHAQIQSLLDDSAGGTWIDLDSSGLDEVSYLRLRVPDDDDPATKLSFELAGVSINSATSTGASPAGVAFAENFSTNPLGTRATSDTGHATYSNTALTASYDLSASPKRTTWPLDTALTDTDSFSVRVEFTIDAIDFDTSNFGQLSFGLINATTTGDQRTSSPSDCWDLLTVDYFPNEDFTTFTPTVIGSQAAGQTNAFANLGFPDGSAGRDDSLINDPGEVGQLPTGIPLTCTLEYDAPSRLLTLRLHDQDINSLGNNQDGDNSTIQYTIPERITFTVDTFAILCWQESSGGTATLTFQHLSVTTPSPEKNYYCWADANITNPLLRAAHLDADSDGLSNLLDYALAGAHPTYSYADNNLYLTWQEDLSRDDVSVRAFASSDIETWNRADDSVIGTPPGFHLHRSTPRFTGSRGFLRLEATRP